MKVDLHTHTYYSDGSLSPKEVVDLALERNVEILAITDHDVILGVSEALKAAEGKNIKVIPGIEVSSSVQDKKETVHLVGLFVNINSPRLKKLSNDIIKLKKYKTKKRLESVNKYFGSNITEGDLSQKTKGTPGLPHIGMVLLERGYVGTIKEGIRSMTNGGPCYIKFAGRVVPSKEAIKIIHGAGGIAILAHLSAYKNENKFITFEEQEKLIKELIGYGLDGLEIYIPDTKKDEIKFGEEMARKYNLKLSGGSDFHNEKFIPQNKLGFLNIEKNKLSVLKDRIKIM